MHYAYIERPLRVPRGLRVVTVGGATLGGSGKTPVAVALARLLARDGRRVALISHAHGATGDCARWLTGDHDANLYGDEATASAEALRGSGVRVTSSRNRQGAVDFAAGWAELVVIDGPLQISPERAAFAVLAVDAERPWGSGACPPLGDLRARPQELLRVSDQTIRISAGGSDVQADATWRLLGATCTRSTRFFSLDELRAMRIGLVTNVARPSRVRATVEAHGVVVQHHIALADHAKNSVADAIARRPEIELWLAPSKLRQAPRAPKTAWLSAQLALGPRVISAVAVALGPRAPAIAWRPP